MRSRVAGASDNELKSRASFPGLYGTYSQKVRYNVIINIMMPSFPGVYGTYSQNVRHNVIIYLY